MELAAFSKSRSVPNIYDRSQLKRYMRNLSSNRGLMVRVFAILMFFVVVWGTLFA